MKKIHRFFLPPDLAHQLRDVLKMEKGKEIDLLDGHGIEARANIVATDPVEVELVSIKQSEAEPTRRVILYAAILKREHFELIVQKATEVGVAKIIPIITARTVKTGLKLDRLRKIASEAAEQSGRGVVPIVHEAMTFTQALIDAAKNDTNILLHPGSTNRQSRNYGSIGIFIGPEGGWTDRAITLAKEAGSELLGLGPLVMRGETAAVIASYLAVHAKI